jgi:hypothetical protein
LNVIKSNFVKQYGLLAALGVSYLAISELGFGFRCPIHSLTGVFCPGCGSTRSVRALLNGDLQLAIHNNALLLAAPALMGIGFLFNKYSKNRMWLYVFLALLVIVVVTFTILRNQPGSELAPL